MQLEGLGVQGSLVEGDSKVVVGCALGSLCPWIRHSIATYEFKNVWAPRSANSVADEMVRQGLTLSSKIVNKLL